MKMKNLFLIVTIAVFFSGCATTGDITAKRAEFESTIPTCKTDRDCEMKWSAARNWVLNNSGWKIQHLTNDFIETYNAVGGSPRIAVRVTKEPLTEGGYKLVVKTWCDNIFGCVPDAWDAAISFNREVGSVK